MYHPPEIAIVSFGVWILDALYTDTLLFLNRITDTHNLYSIFLLNNTLQWSFHGCTYISTQHYFLIVLKHSIVSLYHILATSTLLLEVHLTCKFSLLNTVLLQTSL